MTLLKNLLFGLCLLFFLTSNFTCSFQSFTSRLEPIQNNLQVLIGNEQLTICGTLEQFLIPLKDLPEFSSEQSTDFICSNDYPVFKEIFSTATIILTGHIPSDFHEKDFYSNTIDPFSATEFLDESVQYYRGYIQTPRVHYEGIFKYQSSKHTAKFTIANSLLLERNESNEE